MSKAIEVRQLSKKFRLRPQGGRSLKAVVLDWLGKSGKGKTLWALKEVSFEVHQGEVLGIIGANGAGKSTLLSILAQTMRPSEGTLSVKGRVSSLLELGAGFHPDLTGRENVYLYGSILGLTRKQIDERYENIVAFSELRDFMETPVKHYSSGMYVRLGFAVAVEVDPDILLIDEVLAVGDEKFRKRCLAKIEEFKQKKKTMLVVTHDLEVITKISDRVMLLEGGRVLKVDDPERTVDEYRSLGFVREGAILVKEMGSKQVEITQVRFLNGQGEESDQFQSKSELAIEIQYHAKEKVNHPVFGFGISSMDGKICFGTNTLIEEVTIPHVEGRGKICLKVPQLNLLQGKYYFSFAVHSQDHKTQYHRLDNQFYIFVSSPRKAEGTLQLDCHWGLPEPLEEEEKIRGNV